MTNGSPSIRFGDTVDSMQNNIGAMLHDFEFNPKRPRVLFGMTLGTAQHVPGPTKNNIGFCMGWCVCGGLGPMVDPVRAGNVFNVV